MYNLEKIKKIDVLKINHHSHIDSVINYIGHRPKYIFSTVRNPWDRLVSWYFYYSEFEPFDLILKNTKHLHTAKDIKKYYEYWFKGFDSFILNCLDKQYDDIYRSWNRINDFWYTPTTNQCEWLYRKHEVDEVFRVEKIDKCWSMLIKKFDLDSNIKIPVVRTSVHKKYTDYYNDKTMNKVKNVFEKDIDKFNYKFGEA